MKFSSLTSSDKLNITITGERLKSQLIGAEAGLGFQFVHALDRKYIEMTESD